jgi:hypothetical protein
MLISEKEIADYKKAKKHLMADRYTTLIFSLILLVLVFGSDGSRAGVVCLLFFVISTVSFVIKPESSLIHLAEKAINHREPNRDLEQP